MGDAAATRSQMIKAAKLRLASVDGKALGFFFCP
jgi:hypothetical protein